MRSARCLSNKKRNENLYTTNSPILTYDTTTCLRGGAALWIMLGHLGKVTDFLWLRLFWKSNLLVVGAFFFFSGYGLVYSMKNKQNYFDHFISKRILKILIPAYIVYLYSGVLVLCMEGVNSWQEIIKYIFLFNFMEKTNWYVIEIIFFYILFYLLYKNLKCSVANRLLWVATVLGIIISALAGCGQAWITSSICFPLGVLYYQNEERVNEVIRKYRVIIFLIMNIICVMCYFISTLPELPVLIQNGVFKNMASVGFCIILLEVPDIVSVKNRISNFLGIISMELYLVHCVHYTYFHKFIGTG